MIDREDALAKCKMTKSFLTSILTRNEATFLNRMILLLL